MARSQMASFARPHWLLAVPVRLARALLAVALPVFLLLTGARLVTTNTFVRLEYNRPGFPDDPYGLTRDQRLEYAPYTLEYLRSDKDITYLAALQLEGEPMFTTRELRHMEDVKVVMRAAFRLHLALAGLLLGIGLGLAWYRPARTALRRGLSAGALYTLALIGVLVVVVVAGWDRFFETFHRVFFDGDSWVFSRRTTLIRLFPEQFWFDAALTIGTLAVVGSLLILLAVAVWERRARQYQTQRPLSPEDQGAHE